jgi:ubiquitin-like protein Pup
MPQTTKARERKEAASRTDGKSGSGAKAAHGRKAVADADQILNEIDEVLEENAEEFIKHYHQRGGE